MVRFALLGIVLSTSLLTACGPGKKAEAPAPAPTDSVEAPTSPVELRPTTAFKIDNSFETWTTIGDTILADAVISAPDGVSQADAVKLAPAGSSIYRMFPDLPLTAGQTVEASIAAWTDTPTQMTIYLMHGCSSTERDLSAKVVNLTTEPQLFTAAHTFTRDHECLRVQFSFPEEASNVYLHNLNVD